MSTADAELIQGSSDKADFPETYDPCLAFFRSGVQHEGYWNSSHAKLQLEDAVDAISTIFPQFDCVFLFDQLSGDTKMGSDGLHMRNMNVSHGGSAGMMHATIIHKGGPHPRILHVGNNQEMHFVEGDNGPFWMMLATSRDEARPATRYSKNKKENKNWTTKGFTAIHV